MKDEVSSIYTYDIINSYIIPKPRAGQESDSSQPSSARSKTPEESESGSSSSQKDSESRNQNSEEDNDKIKGIGDPNKGRETILH